MSSRIKAEQLEPRLEGIPSQPTECYRTVWSHLVMRIPLGAMEGRAGGCKNGNGGVRISDMTVLPFQVSLG